jgi:hypothetical protein
MQPVDSGTEGAPYEEVGKRLWDLVTNFQGGGAARNPQFGSAMAGAAGGSPARIQPNWVLYPTETDWLKKCEGVTAISPWTQKLCGSRRFSWDCTEPAGTTGKLCTQDERLSVLSSQTVWQVKVPLIAEMTDGGKLAQCRSPFTINPAKEYRIIAFVKMQIYDTDIAAPAWMPSPDRKVFASEVLTSPPANYPAHSCGEFPLPPLPMPDPLDENPVYPSAPSCSTDGTQAMALPPPLPPKDSCNVVRSRVDCLTAFEADKEQADGTFSLRIVR